MKNPQAIVCTLQEAPDVEGMLFVRFTDILIRMLKAPLLAIGIVLAVILPAQHTFGQSKALDFIIYPDGTAHISQEFSADPQDAELTIPIFGTSIDNIVAQDENGLLLSYEIGKKDLTIQTFGASSVSIDYDSYDLITKKAKLWIFEINPTTDYTLTLPEDAVPTDMTNLPDSAEIIDNKYQFLFPKGENEITYFFGFSGSALDALQAIEEAKIKIDQLMVRGLDFSKAQEKIDEATISFDNKNYEDAKILALEAQQIADTALASKPNPAPADLYDWWTKNVVGIATSIVAIGGAITTLTLILKRTKSVVKKTIEPFLDKNQSESETTDEEITAEMREDDKQLVTFLTQNGGQAFEKELRKKFLLPRTTMWRAVKRLERQGIIEIEKKDFQNLVKLRKKEEGQ
jgi:uncharacterized membrane protein